jgi:hypothetical protein
MINVTWRGCGPIASPGTAVIVKEGLTPALDGMVDPTTTRRF